MISRTKPRQPKGLLILITVLSSIIIIDACRKIDYGRHDDKRPDNPVTAANKFFKMSPNTPSYVKKIAEAIRHQNDKKEFVTKFLREIGQPVWDKCPAQFPNAKPLTGKTEGGGEEDTLVFVPIQLEEDGQVVSFMGALVGEDSVTIRLFRGDKYNGYTGERNAFDELSPELVALQSMVLDYLITPGSDTFRINDLGLYKWSSLWRSSNASRFAFLDTSGGGRGNGINSSSVLVQNGYIPCVNVSFNEYHDVMGYYPPPDNPQLNYVPESYCVSPSNWVSYIHGVNPVVLPVGGGGGGDPWYDDNPCAQMPGGTCGVNGGGWIHVTYNDAPYSPYIADTIGYTSALQNTYPCAYNFIKDSLIGSLRPNVLAQLAGGDIFHDSVYMHLTFDTSTVHTQAGQPSATTTSDSARVDIDGTTHFWAKIKLNGWYLRNGTKEYMVSTIVHELLHAIFNLRWGQYLQWLQWGPPNDIDSNFMKLHYPIYWQNYVINGVPSGQINDHEIMAGDYFSMFSGIVGQFWNPASPQALKDSVLKAMCFGGLTETTAWSLLPSHGMDTCKYRAMQVTAERSLIGTFNTSGCPNFTAHYADSLKLRPSCN